MSSRLNREAFERLVAEDIAWAESHPRTLERDHVVDILRDAPRLYYGPTNAEPIVEPRLPWRDVTNHAHPRAAGRMALIFEAKLENLTVEVQRFTHQCPGWYVTCHAVSASALLVRACAEPTDHDGAKRAAVDLVRQRLREMLAAIGRGR